MPSTAAYDEIADWYEEDFLGGPGAATADGNPASLGGLLDDLLGPGRGICLEVGCSTGIHAARVRGLGWTPMGVADSARAHCPFAASELGRSPSRPAAMQ
jgi:hypothetical protein